jgi:hypothetical protein
MRYLFSFILVCLSFKSFAQDKIYLNNNTLLEGIIINDDKSTVKLALKDKTNKILSKKDIAMIIYESGYSEVVSQNVTLKPDSKEKFNLSEWTVGTNILLPFDGKFGFTIEKKISENYALRIGGTFGLDNYSGLEYTTSFLNNFYIGKGRVKWLNSFGLNLLYLENSYYNIYLYDSNYADLIWPGPPNGFRTSFDLDLCIGSGVNIYITKHLAFSTQLYFSSNLNRNYNYIDIDLNNSGFSFYYKF